MYAADRMDELLPRTRPSARNAPRSDDPHVGSTGEAPGMPADAVVRRALRDRLPEDFGRRQPLRLVWLGLAVGAVLLHLVLTKAYLDGVASGWWMLASLPLAAFAWPCFFFSLHELGHGAVLPPGPLRRIASAVAAFPILLQPTFWTAVHNHHHRFANQEKDCDRRRIFEHEVGELDFSQPLLTVSMIWAVQLVYYSQITAFLAGQLPLPVQRRQVLIELVISALCAIAAGWLMGWELLLYGWLPCSTAGCLLQSLYLVSNHLTRPLATESDSLGTTVSVRFAGGWSHMDFGRHVEHHLYPHVSHDQLAPVTAGLRAHFPERFQERPLLATVRYLLTLPGYYLSSHVLTDGTGRRRVTID